MASDGMLLAGDVLFSRLVAGVLQPFVDLNAGELSMKLNSKTQDVISKGRASYGQPLATVIIPEPADLTISFGKASPKALAMGLQGTVAAYSQASGTATDEVVVANKGGYVDLAFRNIAATGFSVKHTSGTPTYVKDTDYTVDYATGQLFILPTSGIVDGVSLKVSYTYNAVTADRIDGATAASVRGMVHLKGKNLFDDTPTEIKIWDCVLTSDSAIDWLSDKPIEIKLKGRMVTPTGKNSPFELTTNYVNS